MTESVVLTAFVLEAVCRQVLLNIENFDKITKGSFRRKVEETLGKAMKTPNFDNDNICIYMYTHLTHYTTHVTHVILLYISYPYAFAFYLFCFVFLNVLIIFVHTNNKIMYIIFMCKTLKIEQKTNVYIHTHNIYNT